MKKNWPIQLSDIHTSAVLKVPTYLSIVIGSVVVM